MFCSFFLQKSCVFMFFGKHNYHDIPFRHCIVHDRMMVICTSLWNFYLHILLFFLSKIWSFCTHFCSLILSNFWGFSWFLRYFVNEGLWNMQSLQSIWGVENHVFLQLLAHTYTKNHDFVNEIMIFYHAFSDNFRSFAYLHNSWTVRAVFSQTGCFVFEEIRIFS